MKVLVEFDNLQGCIQEFVYYSKFKRINSKGIKEEAKRKLVERFGRHAQEYVILN